jgi:hypothetical protein
MQAPLPSAAQMTTESSAPSVAAFDRVTLDDILRVDRNLERTFELNRHGVGPGAVGARSGGEYTFALGRPDVHGIPRGLAFSHWISQTRGQLVDVPTDIGLNKIRESGGRATHDGRQHHRQKDISHLAQDLRKYAAIPYNAYCDKRQRRGTISPCL